METIKTKSPTIINWLKDFDNQVYLFCMVLLTSPILLAEFTSVSVMKIAFIFWATGVIVTTSLWQFTKCKKIQNLKKFNSGGTVEEDIHTDKPTIGESVTQLDYHLKPDSKLERMYRTGEVPKYQVGEWIPSENKHYLQCVNPECHKYFFGRKNKKYCSEGCKTYVSNKKNYK